MRWTEGRNIEAFVDLVASQKTRPSQRVTHRFPIEQAPAAYELITGKTKEPFLGILITYPTDGQENPATRVPVLASMPPTQAGQESLVTIGVLGAGNYASAVFLPAIKKAGGSIPGVIVSASGMTARQAAGKFGFKYLHL